MRMLCLLSLLTTAAAFSSYRDRLPNGRAVPHPCKANYLWKGVGHENPLGGGARNQFGLDFLASGARWTQTLCAMDSDGDGQTNGMELGDPGCTWTEGTLPARLTAISHPGICTPWEDARCAGKNAWVDCDLGDFECPEMENEEVMNVTLKFDPTPVPNTETNYYCQTFDLPGDDVYQLVANKPEIDNVQVMHHILVYACDSVAEDQTAPTIATPTACGMSASDGCRSIVGLWAVGMTGNCLKNTTGFKFGKDLFTRIRMEFHWNNPELRSDYVDGSGVTFYYTRQLRQTSAATMMVGQTRIEIPPLQPALEVTGTCTSACTSQLWTEPIYVLEALNHMHYLGIKQRMEVYRNGSFLTYLSNEDTYSYDSPVLHKHDPPILLLPGDELKTTCTFNSASRSGVTTYGDGTSDEMCFGFLTVYPDTAFPVTKTCTAHGSKDLCAQYFGGRGEDDCDLNKFSNLSDPTVAQFYSDLTTSCTAFEACRPECLSLWERVSRREPCFRQDELRETVEAFSTSKEGMGVIAALASCWHQPGPCPTCQTCTRGGNSNQQGGNSNQQGGNSNLQTGDGSGAAWMLPNVVSMATGAILALVFTRLF